MFTKSTCANTTPISSLTQQKQPPQFVCTGRTLSLIQQPHQSTIYLIQQLKLSNIRMLHSHSLGLSDRLVKIILKLIPTNIPIKDITKRSIILFIAICFKHPITKELQYWCRSAIIRQKLRNLKLYPTFENLPSR